MKLTREEKGIRKECKAFFGKMGGVVFNDGNTTFAWLPVFPGANTGHLGTAICNPHDDFNRKYGEYLAMLNAETGVLTPRYLVSDLQDIMHILL